MVNVVLLAGGLGTRLDKNVAKQHIFISNHQIIEYTLMAFSNSDLVDRIIVVSNPLYIEHVNELKSLYPKLKIVCGGGDTRMLSLYNALKILQSDTKDEDIVIVSDAARPCITKREINELIKSLGKYDVVTSCLECYETILKTNEDKINEIIPRDGLFRQTSPEGYKYKKLKQLYLTKDIEIISKYKNIGIDQLFKNGENIGHILSNSLNFKITTQQDLDFFKTIVNLGFEKIINN